MPIGTEKSLSALNQIRGDFMNDKNYNRGVAWGKKVFRAQVKTFGETGIYMADKAATTCGKYAEGRMHKTKTGKVLDGSMRSFYRGARAGMQAAYRDLQKR